MANASALIERGDPSTPDDDAWIVVHSPCFSRQSTGPPEDELFGHQRRRIARQRLTTEEGRAERLHREHQDDTDSEAPTSSVNVSPISR